MAEPNYHEASMTRTGAVVVSEVEPDEVLASHAFSLLDPRFQRELASWAEDVQGGYERRRRGIFERDKFVTPSKIYEQMAMAYDAADDDVVANVLETSESIAFQKVHFESDDPDQQDVWNQIGRDLDLDGFLRQALRELNLVSQFYAVRRWGLRRYRVRGKSESGRTRRQEFNLYVPQQLGFLDPLRVVPVNCDPFGNYQLAWIATDDDMALYRETEQHSLQTDEMVRGLFLGRYDPSSQEARDLEREDVPVERLMLLNPAWVFRHTLTKAPYERWARVRMRAVFPLLDLKQQLREMDRAFLLGGVNFIVLVTRGTDQMPANRAEVDTTATQMRTQSRSPVIVSDHRINIEIITPDVEHVLNEDKWAVLDERIMMRMWGTFQIPSETSSRETSLTLGKVIARGLASRRHMLKRTIEKEIIRVVQDMPANEGFDAQTSIEYSPRRIELEFDPVVVTLIQELRDRGDISRETLLNEFGFDEAMEANRREREDKLYAKMFKPVNVPFDSPQRVTPGGSGRSANRPPANDDGGNNDEGDGS